MTLLITHEKKQSLLAAFFIQLKRKEFNMFIKKSIFITLAPKHNPILD